MEDWESVEVLSASQLKRFLSAVIKSPNEKTPDKLKAAHMLLSMDENGNPLKIEDLLPGDFD